ARPGRSGRGARRPLARAHARRSPARRREPLARARSRDVGAHEAFLRRRSPARAAPGARASGGPNPGPIGHALVLALLLGGLHAAGGLELIPMTWDDASTADVTELVRRISARDPDAESELVARYGRGVSILIQRASSDPSVVDDVFQQTFQL